MLTVVLPALPPRPRLGDERACNTYRRRLVERLSTLVDDLAVRVCRRSGVRTDAFAVVVVDTRDEVGADLAEQLRDAGAVARDSGAPVVLAALPMSIVASMAAQMDPSGAFSGALELELQSPGAVRAVVIAAGGIAVSQMVSEVFGRVTSGGSC